MASGDGVTDVVDLSGNGKGVALGVFPYGYNSVSEEVFSPVQDGAVSGAPSEINGPAFLATLDRLGDLITTGYGYGNGSPPLTIPTGVFDLGNTTLDLTHSLIIEGDSGCGHGGAGASVLKWNAGVTGIRTHYSGTQGATGDGSGAIGSPASIIRNLTLYGTFSGTESEAHGIHLRGRAAIRDVFITNFAGDGIYMRANVGGAGFGYLGEVNGTEITNVTGQNCRNGIYIEEADSNALVISNPLLAANRRYGLWSKNTIGSTLLGGISASNGLTTGWPTMCNYGGHRYYVLPNQEAGAAINPPTGTTANNTWWAWQGVHSAPWDAAPAWYNGIVVRAGGVARLESLYEQWTVAGFYQEGDQPPFQIAATCQALILSPMAGVPVRFDGTPYRASITGNGTGIKLPSLYSGADTTWGQTILNGALNEFIRMIGTSGKGWFFEGGGDYLVLNDTGGHQVFAIDHTTGRFLNLDVVSNYKVGGVNVVGARGAAVADATDAASAITQLNALLARMRAHGLIA